MKAKLTSTTIASSWDNDMFYCYLINLNSGVETKLSDLPLEVNDDNEYSIRVDVFGHDNPAAPRITIGDIDIKVGETTQSTNDTTSYASIRGEFFDNAFFLNYFGQCELIISIGEVTKKYSIEVNVTSYKAGVASEMLNFLSNNTEDILQTCYSKSKTGFSHKNGHSRSVIKFSALTQTIQLIESLFPEFKSDSIYNISHKLEFNSNKPLIVDEICASWLSENMDSLEISNSKDYKIRVKKKHYQVDIPNSITVHNTDLKENRVLHQFVLVALEYLNINKKNITAQTTVLHNSFEYDEYIKFDTIIKRVIKPILLARVRLIDDLINRINRINLFFRTTIPVKKTTRDMPIQTSSTLRHRHYSRAFNKISEFYNASDADKQNTEFLLGLRNLSQLFELCCLYSLVRYFNDISTPINISWASNSMEWDATHADKVNVLANNFTFESEHYQYTLNYEKKFYSFCKETMKSQKDNLVRIDVENNYVEPDFTIKVTNKKSEDYYYIILDAKFSRNYKMKSTKTDKAPSVLQSIFTKYSTNLRAYKDGELVNVTRYVGVLFGLSKNDKEKNRICMFNKMHDIDGDAPIFPFSAASFISFSDNDSGINNILNKYISQ